MIKKTFTTALLCLGLGLSTPVFASPYIDYNMYDDYYTDEYSHNDYSDVRRKPVIVERPQPQLINEDLNMELRIFFEPHQSNIQPKYKAEIAKAAEALNEFPNATVYIEGHTDDTIPYYLSEKLSFERANKVKSALVNTYSVNPNRIAIAGFASEQPIADNRTTYGRAMNRRVFITISGNRQTIAD